MFKLVVLCAFFAAAAAKPGTLFAAPFTHYSTYLAPSTTTITKQASSVIHPSPLLYHAPLTYAHFIKKRSAQFPLTYAAPATYYSNYWPTTTYSAPYITGYSAPIQHASIASVPAVHLIKKRSAPAISTYNYIPAATTYAAPFFTSTYSSPYYTTSYNNPLISYSHPIAYSHLIKKRSAAFAYVAPTSYSHQSRFDLRTTHTPYTAISYASPYAYASHFGVSHVY